MRSRFKSTRGGVFDPDDARRVKHTRLGVWDLYEEVQPKLNFIPNFILQRQDILQSLQYVWLAIKDIASLRSCWIFLFAYVILSLALSFLPAISLWYSGQLLKIVETTVETRTIDRQNLIRIAIGRVGCSFLGRCVTYFRYEVMQPLTARIKAHYAAHIFNAHARLDLPTFEDPLVQAQLEVAANQRSSVAWESVRVVISLCSTIVQLITQISVLLSVLRGQRDGLLLAILSFAPPLLNQFHHLGYHMPGAWAATCRNEQYVRMEGIKKIVTSSSHRKEIVTGNLAAYLYTEFVKAQEILGYNVEGLQEMLRKRMTQNRLLSFSFLKDAVSEIPQIVFMLRAVQHPTSIPLSLTSLGVIQSAVARFSQELFELFDYFGSISETFDALRKLYGLPDIPNKIADGFKPFPEDQQALTNGVSVEFRNVSFCYPGNEQYALKDVSFKIEAGQLCVIVGTNGSGKSTVLKLISRLYDPTEGQIFLNDCDIRTLKLHDLRRALALLFQDYTYFPLSIKENIGLGDPEIAFDDDKIMEAARLGGALEMIERLPDGFDTYLDRPVRDRYSGLPQGTKMLFGRSVDYTTVRKFGGFSDTMSTNLSGGQMQRLALSRTFMRTLNPERGVGLLLFDEPSASLDPVAEHDLFQRLRALRNNKTMIFSSHRFGNLTRHADVILYMKDSVVEEVGTHTELMTLGRGYAQMYSIQAEAFQS